VGKRQHGEKSNEAKAIQAKREEKKLPYKQPHESLTRLSANVAQPKDIQTLQRTVGNRAVANMIQRQTAMEGGGTGSTNPKSAEYDELKVKNLSVGGLKVDKHSIFKTLYTDQAIIADLIVTNKKKGRRT
jgi:hypothetical protein